MDKVEPLPCGCVPHKTRMRGMWGFYCETEDQGYCNFECPHQPQGYIQVVVTFKVPVYDLGDYEATTYKEAAENLGKWYYDGSASINDAITEAVGSNITSNLRIDVSVAPE